MNLSPKKLGSIVLIACVFVWGIYLFYTSSLFINNKVVEAWRQQIDKQFKHLYRGNSLSYTIYTTLHAGRGQWLPPRVLPNNDPVDKALKPFLYKAHGVVKKWDSASNTVTLDLYVGKTKVFKFTPEAYIIATSVGTQSTPESVNVYYSGGGSAQWATAMCVRDIVTLGSDSPDFLNQPQPIALTYAYITNKCEK